MIKFETEYVKINNIIFLFYNVNNIMERRTEISRS